MRLINQDGMIDIPYENACVSINYRNKNQIIAWNFGCENCEIATMATYSTEAKALKVMEMLRKRYLDYLDVKLETFWYSNDYPKVFQFPEDEEMED